MSTTPGFTAGEPLPPNHPHHHLQNVGGWGSTGPHLHPNRDRATTTPTPVPAKRSPKKWVPLAGAAILGLIIGSIIGQSGTGETATPETAATVTTTATTEVTAPSTTETVTETVTVVPAECMTALEDAEALAVISSDLAYLISDHMNNEADAWDSVANNDYTFADGYFIQITEMNAEIEALTERVDANTFAYNAAACRKEN